MNPELRRNLWLEFSLHRVIAAPVMIALVMALILASDSKNPLDSIASAAAYGFAVIVLLWGAKLAGASVIDEARERTWDAQRMSSITPWRMTWGKLLGAPSFAWYCGLILLLVFVVSGSQMQLPVARYAALMVCGAILLHAMALNASVLAARNGVANRSSGILIIILLLFVLMTLRAFVPDDLQKSMAWWGISLPRIDFMLYTAVAFGAWAVLGAYRSMCDELEIRTTPWALPSFILFTAAYFAGFAMHGATNEPSAFFGVMASSVIIAIVFVYALLLAEKSGASAWQRLRARLRVQQVHRALQELPLWLVALGLGLLTALATTLASGGSESGSGSDGLLHQVGLAPIALMLFAVRDAAIFQFFALARQPRRVTAATLFYLLLLYGLLPGLLKATGAAAIAQFVLPPLIERPAFTTVVMAVQAAIAIGLAYARWRKVHAPDLHSQTVKSL